MGKTAWALLLTAAAMGGPARALEGPIDPGAQEGAAPGRTGADAGSVPRQDASLAESCAALLRGEVDPAARDDLAPRCEKLLRAGGNSTGRETPPPGEAVGAAFTNAAGEVTGGKQAGVGATSRGEVRNTLVTNPLGWFSGLGLNVEYSRPLEGFDRLSWVADARYARANASNGEVTSFGIGGGVDLFLFGRNNEGLRIGPRMELAFGSENIQGSTTFGRLGVSGEVGYSFIASSGLTAGVAGGIGARLAGDEQNEDFESFTGGELGPYLKLGIGYSW